MSQTLIQNISLLPEETKKKYMQKLANVLRSNKQDDPADHNIED